MNPTGYRALRLTFAISKYFASADNARFPTTLENNERNNEYLNIICISEKTMQLILQMMTFANSKRMQELPCPEF